MPNYTAPPGFAAQLLEDLPLADVRHVLAVFSADLRRLADILAVTVEAADDDSFRRAAHALAGAAGAVGAASLQEACRTAMTASTSGSGAAMRTLGDAVQAQVAGAAADCDTVLAQLGQADG